ncbi:DMT family transporter [Acinetobacter gerneri]|uniref:DMT family transporter n=1 Tax=Acinetobacter gerneri TaxID=202952 RepID=UPI0023F12E8D|nr:multidrug resistance efflux transporter family protein [Acinetobacter gerneri]MCH4245489.1 multidrug resistance efflux transporter family protein [Acinetobacter gerneri]
MQYNAQRKMSQFDQYSGEFGTMRAIIYGILASCFFSSAFILNRAMELGGGSWLWSSSLRFWFMTPILLLIVAFRGKLKSSFAHLRENFSAYLLWSTVGFGLFYAPLTFASIYSPGWLVAGTWQITIIAGSLLVPFLGGFSSSNKVKIPWSEIKWSVVILLGVFMILLDQMTQISFKQMLAGLIPVVFAAFMYPLGNRKMMQICQDKIQTPERVLNMTIASLPFWLVLSIIGGVEHGAPSMSQVYQAFLVALFSGVIATLLFFTATSLVHKNQNQLAIVEATQSGEVLFTLLGEILIFGMALPSRTALLGVALIIIGMIIHSLASIRHQKALKAVES